MNPKDKLKNRLRAAADLTPEVAPAKPRPKPRQARGKRP
jgi:hypothetical protein